MMSKHAPEPPKRPATAYMMFTADHRAKAKEKNPELTFGELGKFLGEMWGKLPELQKEAYKTRASKAMDKYKVNFSSLFVISPSQLLGDAVVILIFHIGRLANVEGEVPQSFPAA